MATIVSATTPRSPSAEYSPRSSAPVAPGGAATPPPRTPRPGRRSPRPASRRACDRCPRARAPPRPRPPPRWCVAMPERHQASQVRSAASSVRRVTSSSARSLTQPPDRDRAEALGRHRAHDRADDDHEREHQQPGLQRERHADEPSGAPTTPGRSAGRCSTPPRAALPAGRTRARRAPAAASPCHPAGSSVSRARARSR